MQVLSRIDSVSFNPASRRYEGEVSIMLNDGGEVAVTASVIGSPQWAYERVARELLSAARVKYDA